MHDLGIIGYKRFTCIKLYITSLSPPQLKEEVAKVMGVEAPVESQCLIFAGKILKDDQSVESQAVKDGVTVHLVIRSTNKVEKYTW